MFPDTDGIAGKPKSLSLRHRKTSGRGDPFGKRFLPIVIKGGRKIQQFATAQGAQAGIEVVKPVVDQFEWDDFPVKPVAECREHMDI